MPSAEGSASGDAISFRPIPGAQTSMNQAQRQISQRSDDHRRFFFNLTAALVGKVDGGSRLVIFAL
jgi:hypothetical protein